MTDKPILFSGPMVRAILEGRKTQTRRVLKPQPTAGEFQGVLTDTNEALFGHTDITRHCQAIRVPCAAGDRLWVREAWRTSPAYDDLKPSWISGDKGIFYEADGFWKSWEGGETGLISGGRKRPSIFMPRWASRLTLIVADVRAQRLQDVNYDDLLAEGIQSTEIYIRREKACVENNSECGSVSRASFQELWDSLNATRGYAWADNPWVWAVTFIAHRCNIDQME